MGTARVHNSDAVSNRGLVFFVGDTYVEQLEIRKGENGPDHNHACPNHLFNNDLGNDWFSFPFEQALSIIFSDAQFSLLLVESRNYFHTACFH